MKEKKWNELQDNSKLSGAHVNILNRVTNKSRNAKVIQKNHELNLKNTVKFTDTRKPINFKNNIQSCDMENTINKALKTSGIISSLF